MQRIGLLLVIAAACGGGGEGGGDVFGVRAAQFATEACENPCVPAQQQQDCSFGVVSNLESVRTVLADEDACIECVRAKTQVVAQLVANECMLSEQIETSLAGTCDLDPNNDFDFDGDPANDLQESCLGAGSFPFLFDDVPVPGDPRPL
jgi:hypothetical protein